MTGEEHPDIKKMGELGASGRCPGNVERDFHRHFGVHIEPWYVPLPLVQDYRTGGWEIERFPVLAPHELAASLHMMGSDVFQEFVANESNCSFEHFWGAVAAEPWAANRPTVLQAADKSKLVPVVVHGDEAEFLDDQQLLILSWGNPLCSGHSPRMRFLIAALPSRRMVVGDGGYQVTLQVLMRFVAWSLNVLQVGVFPEASWDGDCLEIKRIAARLDQVGKPICGDFKFCYVGLIADQKFDQQVHKWDRGYEHAQVCAECLADDRDGPFLYTDVGESAAWRETIGQYATCHSTFTEVIGWHPSLSRRDLLHLLYVNGVGNDVAGSALLLLAGGHGTTRNNLDTALQNLYREFREWCRGHCLETTLDGLSLAEIHWPTAASYPWLRGKASDVRLVISWISDQKIAQLGRTEGMCIRNLARFTYLIRTSRPIFVDGVGLETSRCGMSFVSLLVQLAEEALRRSVSLWKVRPKLHQVRHVAFTLRTSLVNPQIFSRWQGEDFVGRIANIGAQTHRRNTGLRTLQRHLLLLRKETLDCARG